MQNINLTSGRPQGLLANERQEKLLAYYYIWETRQGVEISSEIRVYFGCHSPV